MNYYIYLGISLFLYMNLWFVVSLIEKRNDVADVAWGLGFVFLTWVSFLITRTSSLLGLRGIIVTGLVTLWGLRLAWHIYIRNKGKEEDPRYQKWRKQWGKFFYPRSYLQVFMLQGLLLFMISYPVLYINKFPVTSLGWLDGLGILIWIVGFSFEVIADWQLSNFLSDSDREGIMQSGLWRYSRHPNYFGEVTQWWGIFLIALAIGGWQTIISPVTITILILYVSGVPPLEEKMEGEEGFAEYKNQTSKFFPLPPNWN